jgi:hypothetical protein
LSTDWWERVRRLKSVVFPVFGRPTIPSFMAAGA